VKVYPKTPALPPGIGVFPDIAPTDYFRWAALDYSTLTKIGEWDQQSNAVLPAPDRSPAHVLNYLTGEPEEPTDAQAFGSAFHTLLLESHRFKERYHVLDKPIDRRTKDGKAEWSYLLEHYPEDRILTPDNVAAMEAMVRGAARNEHAYPLMGAIGDCELSAVWVESETGVRMKGRLDKLIRGRDGSAMVVDIKTTRNAHPRKFCVDAARYGYHVQAAIYHDAVVALLGVVPAYLIVAVEKSAPHNTVVYQVRPEEISAGRTVYRALIRDFLNCEKADHWPGYEDKHLVPLLLPEWAMAERDEETNGVETAAPTEDQAEAA
jgi:hypothetical protein